MHRSFSRTGEILALQLSSWVIGNSSCRITLPKKPSRHQAMKGNFSANQILKEAGDSLEQAGFKPLAPISVSWVPPQSSP